MKAEKLIWPAIFVVGAYLLYKKSGEAASDLGGAVQDLLGAPGAALQKTQSEVKQSTASVTGSVVNTGGTVNRVLNAGRYADLAPGAAQVLANVDFLNQISGSQYITAKIEPGKVVIVPSAGLAGGALNVPANQAIASAVRAVPASVGAYGMSNVSGGITAFNITSQGTAATAAYPSQASVASALARGLI